MKIIINNKVEKVVKVIKADDRPGCHYVEIGKGLSVLLEGLDKKTQKKIKENFKV